MKDAKPDSTERRPYRSALRDDQARATRRRIVDAGATLFVERGYGPTTIDAIADRAEVSRRTVFTSIGGKAAVLKLAFDWAIAGDDEPVAIADRPEVQDLFDQDDAAAVVRDYLEMNAVIASRLARLFHVLVVAADSDPEAAALLEVLEAQREDGALVFAARLDQLGALSPALGVDEAAAIADLLMDPLPYQKLVLQHGWSDEAYIDHVRRAGIAMLLGERT